MTSNTPEIKLHAFPSPSPMMKTGKDTALIDSKKPDKPEGQRKIDKKIFDAWLPACKGRIMIRFGQDRKIQVAASYGQQIIMACLPRFQCGQKNCVLERRER